MAGEPVKLISIWLLHAAIPTSAKPYTENMPDLVSPGGLRVDLAAREASFIVCGRTGDALIAWVSLALVLERASCGG